MNRRNFIGLAVASALAPATLVEGAFENIRYRGVPLVFNSARASWCNRAPLYGRSSFEAQCVDIREMERLWRECANYNCGPIVIHVDKRTYEMVQAYTSELFA